MRKGYVVCVAVMTAVLAAGGIVTVAMGNREFSQNENRYLEQFPKWSWSGVMDGEIQEEITTAFNDQFPARDFWTALSTRAEKILGHRDVGGVYIGKNHYYFEKIMNQDISQTNYFQNLRFVNHVQSIQPDARVTALLVPSPGSILPDYLPEHAQLYDAGLLYQSAEDVLADGTLIDMRKEMTEAADERQVYYKTDHHWTLAGAYEAYCAYVRAMGRTGQPYEDFGVETVSDSFYGTLYSKALDADAVPDALDAPGRLPQVEVSCDGQERDSIYDASKLEEKDKYAYFFGGNFGEVILRPEQGGSGVDAGQEGGKSDEDQGDEVSDQGSDGSEKEKKPRLLVVKDSFANSMVPFLLQDYSDIRMLDLRYFKTSVREYLEEYNADEILILYEMSNFAQDHQINKLMK